MAIEYLAGKALEVIVKNPDILNQLSLPNVNFPTLGGHVMWNNIAVYKGWKIQQNTLTHHCRIIDSNNIRRAWGGMDAMEKIFEKLADHN
ncbi:MAG: hypothetical protein K2H82_06845 [Oscillospiraceae bacterium]|nr:hypothetical protein [Oscillospiraceae bacterium]